MKTLFNTALKSTSLAIILLASVFSLTAAAATVKVDAGTVAHPDIKKLIVKGNTKVILVQSNSEYITTEQSDLENVSLKQIGQTLTINSSASNPVTVFVYVKDLYRIDASDQASVRTSGKFKLKYLQVLLKDAATASVKATTESLYTVIDGSAKLELLGTAENHIFKVAGIAKMDTTKFAALHTEYENTPEKAVAFNATKEAFNATQEITIIKK